MAHIILIRGLNTYGDDQLRLGPLDFGPCYGPLKTALEAYGHTVFCIYGMGYESLDHQVEIAEKELLTYFSRLDMNTRYHVLAHSMGGLVARKLAYKPSLSGRIRSIMTLGTPHHGTDLPKMSEQLIKSNPFVANLLRFCNYDLGKRYEIFRQFLPEEVEKFNKLHPNLFDIQYASVVAQTPASYLSWPYKYSAAWMKKYVGTPSDGFINSSSQKWGTVIGQTYLDHLAQIGYFLQLHPKRKAECQREFQRVLDVINLYWHSMKD